MPVKYIPLQCIYRLHTSVKFKFIGPFFIMRLRCILKQIWQIILPDLKLLLTSAVRRRIH